MAEVDWDRTVFVLICPDGVVRHCGFPVLDALAAAGFAPLAWQVLWHRPDDLDSFHERNITSAWQAYRYRLVDIVTTTDIERIFKLKGQFVDAMNEVVAGEGNHLTMVIGHQVLRRMLEEEARSRGAGVVAFGFNADDLVASMVTWMTSGFRMGGIPVREIGDLRYVFPLYRITKKELTLYLELVAPELNRQGTSGRFTSGPDERSMSYALTDHLARRELTTVS